MGVDAFLQVRKGFILNHIKLLPNGQKCGMNSEFKQIRAF